MLTKQTLMQQYIEESPAVTEAYLNQPLDDASRKLVAEFAAGTPVILTGCGTSYHLAMLGARYLQQIAGMDARAVPAFDLAWYQAETCRGKIVLAISQSGASKATRDAIAQARRFGARIVSLTASEETAMAKESNLHLVLPGGREKALPKTRMFTTISVQFIRLALETLRCQGRPAPDLLPASAELRRAMEQVLDANRAVVDQAAEAWQPFEMFTFVGGGPAWVTACEIALKMRENNYTFAEGYEVEEFAHGRTCSFAQDRPLVAFVLRGASVARINDVVANARHLSVPVLAVVEEGVEQVPDADFYVHIPAMPSEFAAAILAALPMQLFSHQFTLMRDIDPDSIRMDQPDFMYAHRKWIFPPGTH